MSVESITRRGRTAADARMVDACTLAHPGGDPTFDDGTYTPDPATTYYTGPCEVQLEGSIAQESEAGGAEVTFERLIVKVPISVEDAAINDVVTITDSLLDPDLVGQVFTVTSTHAKSFATARRLQVERTST